jgi:hypothetical protein
MYIFLISIQFTFKFMISKYKNFVHSSHYIVALWFYSNISLEVPLHVTEKNTLSEHTE